MVAQSNAGNDSNEGSDDVTSRTDGRTFPNIICYKCNRNMHYYGECPEEDKREQGERRGLNMMQFGINLMQSRNANPHDVVDRS